MQGWKIIVFGNYFFRGTTDSLGRKATQLIQPQIFSQIFRFGIIAEGAEILVVVIDLKQRKHLIDSINQLRFVWPVLRMPSFCLRARR